MATFSALSLVYILQRRYYGAINTNLDKVSYSTPNLRPTLHRYSAHTVILLLLKLIRITLRKRNSEKRQGTAENTAKNRRFVWISNGFFDYCKTPTACSSCAPKRRSGPLNARAVLHVILLKMRLIFMTATLLENESCSCKMTKNERYRSLARAHVPPCSASDFRTSPGTFVL